MCNSNSLENIAFWIMIPTVRLTENHPLKWIRVLGFFATFLLFPLVFVGSPFLLVAVLVRVIEDI